ncbi:very short patch repair endonuclease [Roseovarius sp. SCSIO 43702]|uniref:very short patch repair endonuclease n=1 Tax=Roseovarius sp. SCSIO 43702 TaxID=2823043 RepID=UPI001C73C90B|nr:very short patch repair endonuclease [Roseovarius sp. SCSIO 43702]QYX55949.1 very short patch repair endonuclease [Roseovarius sp. SCSIO 43702]
MDRISPERRSALMANVRSKNTGPEMIVRSIAHKLGLRFRLHRRDLPGTPDLVFPKYRLVLFVHGCFWHRHIGCKKATMPKSRTDYWAKKFSQNTERDRRNRAKLEANGWRVETIWECQTKDSQTISDILREITNGPRGVRT